MSGSSGSESRRVLDVLFRFHMDRRVRHAALLRRGVAHLVQDACPSTSPSWTMTCTVAASMPLVSVQMHRSHTSSSPSTSASSSASAERPLRGPQPPSRRTGPGASDGQVRGRMTSPEGAPSSGRRPLLGSLRPWSERRSRPLHPSLDVIVASWPVPSCPAAPLIGCRQQHHPGPEQRPSPATVCRGRPTRLSPAGRDPRRRSARL